MIGMDFFSSFDASLATGVSTTVGASPNARQKSTPKYAVCSRQLQASDNGSILARSRPDYEKYGSMGTPSVSTSPQQPLPSTHTLDPVSNKPVSDLPKVSTSAKGLGSAESMRFTAATTFSRLDLLILKHSLAFWTLRETIRMQLMFRKDPVPCEAFHPPPTVFRAIGTFLHSVASQP
ncbi:uncharacterized protein [Drosophila suzukii]|uniref:Uncharacterized protein isoform X2 n=1 Tax=Drosophila suzukii TaxID=28584 RepID=A0ABM4TX83_DROSZ